MIKSLMRVFWVPVQLTGLPEDFASLPVTLPLVRKLVVRTDDETAVSRFLHVLPNIEQITLERSQTLGIVLDHLSSSLVPFTLG
jgi:hypothetical protein